MFGQQTGELRSLPLADGVTEGSKITKAETYFFSIFFVNFASLLFMVFTDASYFFFLCTLLL